MGIAGWLWTKAAKKAAVRVVGLFAAWVVAHKLDALVPIDVNYLTALVFGLLEVLRNWLKVKIGIKWL